MQTEQISESKKKKKGGGVGGNGFKVLSLSDPVYQAVACLGFRMPTPVQRKAIPVIMTGVDTVVMARTGSGKTCAFLIPLMEKLLSNTNKTTNNRGSSSTVRGVILSPTRELSMQTLKVFRKLTASMDNPIRAIGIHGGESMEKQFDMLASKPDVIIATPGRLAHHLSEIPDFSLSVCEMCILDEADRLLEMGFAMQIRQVAKSLPEHCTKVMLSATMPKMLVEFTGLFAVDPTVIRLDNEATVSAELRIAFVTCRSLDKDAVLLEILRYIQEDKEAHKDSRTGLTIVFAATRHHVEYIHTLLNAAGVASTMIYGTLDQEARKANLATFKNGKTPVLCVTDVAARGIDLPLLDHVIHYHFPPSPKLFVHRSGRVARAGRIGFCWGLVEPDELPYMVDLHLFLGRRLTPGTLEDRELSYTLEEMTPDTVHYGCLPESIVTQEVENVNRIVTGSDFIAARDVEALNSLRKVCNNAMKQYRRTRTEASREGVRRAKEILEGTRMETGQRVGGGSIVPHPLFRTREKQLMLSLSENESGFKSLENMKKREEFLRAVSSFRPKETVFEAFATGGGKEIAVLSQVDKGRTTAGKKNDSSTALTAMRSMRRQMRIARDKGSALVVAGSEIAKEISNNDGDCASNAPFEKCGEPQKNMSNAAKKLVANGSEVDHSRRRLSKADRRRLKKNPNDANLSVQDDVQVDDRKRSHDFRDPNFYIENDFTADSDEAQRLRHIEAVMQPSAAVATHGSFGKAMRLEEAMLDILGDENEELIKKQRLTRWDKSKRKYVQTTVGAELSGDSKSKKMRLESGQLMKSDSAKLGDLYQKWQKKTSRSVGRHGVFDDGNENAVTDKSSRKQRMIESKTKKTETLSNGSETKSAIEIKKERARKENMKIKNMKKGERRFRERKGKSTTRAGTKRGRR